MKLTMWPLSPTAVYSNPLCGLDFSAPRTPLLRVLGSGVLGAWSYSVCRVGVPEDWFKERTCWNPAGEVVGG